VPCPGIGGMGEELHFSADQWFEILGRLMITEKARIADKVVLRKHRIKVKKVIYILFAMLHALCHVDTANFFMHDPSTPSAAIWEVSSYL
jgi:hypothetical protein